MKRLPLLSGICCIAMLVVVGYPRRAAAQIVLEGKYGGRVIIGGPAGISETADTGQANYPGTHGFVPGYGYYPDYSYNWPTLREAIQNNPRRQRPHQIDPEPIETAPPSCAVVQVLIPAHADLWFSGTKTEQVGLIRRFVTPALAPDKTYTYDVRASWQEDGRQVTRTQTVTVYPNQRTIVDFLSPETLPAPRTVIPQ
jgi:uncharacterized protein (TIGR03000 family)